MGVGVSVGGGVTATVGVGVGVASLATGASVIPAAVGGIGVGVASRRVSAAVGVGSMRTRGDGCRVPESLDDAMHPATTRAPRVKRVRRGHDLATIAILQ